MISGGRRFRQFTKAQGGKEAKLLIMVVPYAVHFILVAALTEHSLRKWEFTSGHVRDIRRY